MGGIILSDMWSTEQGCIYLLKITNVTNIEHFNNKLCHLCH